MPESPHQLLVGEPELKPAGHPPGVSRPDGCARSQSLAQTGAPYCFRCFRSRRDTSCQSGWFDGTTIKPTPDKKGWMMDRSLADPTKRERWPNHTPLPT